MNFNDNINNNSDKNEILIKTEARFIELETKVLFQEKTIEELNEALYAQQQHLTELEKRLELLNKKLSSSLNQDQDIRSNEKPPHY